MLTKAFHGQKLPEYHRPQVFPMLNSFLPNVLFRMIVFKHSGSSRSTRYVWYAHKIQNGRSRPRKPFISRLFCAQRGLLRPWSQTMVSEGARPWGRGRSGDCELGETAKGRLGLRCGSSEKVSCTGASPVCTNANLFRTKTRDLALFRSLCNKRQLSRKNKF